MGYGFSARRVAEEYSHTPFRVKTPPCSSIVDLLQFVHSNYSFRDPTEEPTLNIHSFHQFLLRKFCKLKWQQGSLDGTLTAPRKVVTPDMLNFMKELRKVVTVGVVGGSDLVKISEQLGKSELENISWR